MKTSELIGNITPQVTRPVERFAKSCGDFIRNTYENNTIHKSDIQGKTWECIYSKLARDKYKYKDFTIEDMIGSIKVDVFCKSGSYGTISFRKQAKSTIYSAKLIAGNRIIEASDVYADIALSNIYDGYTIGVGDVREHDRYTLEFDKDDGLSHAYIPFFLFFRLCTADIARELSRLTGTGQFIRDGYAIDTTDVKNKCKLTKSDYDDKFKDLVSFRNNYIQGEECEPWIQDRKIYHYAPLLSEAETILLYDRCKDKAGNENHIILCEMTQG